MNVENYFCILWAAFGAAIDAKMVAKPTNNIIIFLEKINTMIKIF